MFWLTILFDLTCHHTLDLLGIDLAIHMDTSSSISNAESEDKKRGIIFIRGRGIGGYPKQGFCYDITKVSKVNTISTLRP